MQTVDNAGRNYKLTLAVCVPGPFEPFGTDMILVTASTVKLLPDARPDTEPTAPYFAALRQALLLAASHGGKAASGAIMLNTVP